MNYYHKFLPNISSVVRPLHRLLEKDVKWDWNEECKVSFKRVKDLVTSEQVLCHYDPELPIRLACDASPFGLGVVLSHKMLDRMERPIAFASRSLNKAERDYVQSNRQRSSRQLEHLSLTNNNIRRETASDKTLSRVYEFVQKGWTVNDDIDLKPYFNQKNALSISQGCLQWGKRTIVPKKFRQQTLELLHYAHPGVVKMIIGKELRMVATY
ncbi:unnamed protein product [Mytilus coruscus]|uniref:Reverse transcriptase/retrotransposon-derived protein RNase H-like domain-containing protein n=1 Tax=Mytilus coruscus TaxID=42192 RepID=A0A6J8A9X1_MYTCO|nr:unnamed protein product [Mytilus coruscus]